jgi:hypothetical protein
VFPDARSTRPLLLLSGIIIALKPLNTMIMNKFIKVTIDGVVLYANVNHIVAVEPGKEGCYIYFSSPLNCSAVRKVDESCDEVLRQINE